MVQTLAATTSDGRAVSVDVVHISSGRPGPVLAVFAAMHGTEYASVAALGRLIQQLDSARVAGTLRLVPVANRLAFETRTMYVSPADGKNLNRSFPGRPDGSYTEVLADLLWRNVVDGANAVIDVHGGEVVEGLFPFAGAYAAADRPEVGDVSRRLAEAFHPPYLVLNQLPPEVRRTDQRLSLMATDAGIPAALVEAGQRGELEDTDISFIADGVVNAMRVLGMIDETVETSSATPVIVREVPVIASQTGLFHSAVAPGDRVAPGQELGNTRDYTGATVERFAAEWTGVVLGVIGPSVVAGGMPLVIGVVADGWAPHQPL
jgi:predicted deacylase